MKVKSLENIQRKKSDTVKFNELPTHVHITKYAKDKSYAINALVRQLYNQSYEWYGFTLAETFDPTTIVDIGLPKNNANGTGHTGLSVEGISRYVESLPKDIIINGWIHSHGNLGFRQFSTTDDENHKKVLDFVAPKTMRQLAKIEVDIQYKHMLIEGQYSHKELQPNSVAIVTDRPIGKVSIYEAINGAFSYGIVIGDEGWHKQQIHYKTSSALTNRQNAYHTDADLVTIDSNRNFNRFDKRNLERELIDKLSLHHTPAIPRYDGVIMRFFERLVGRYK